MDIMKGTKKILMLMGIRGLVRVGEVLGYQRDREMTNL
jgi:hypothetical protein